jgi:cysteine synthase A
MAEINQLPIQESDSSPESESRLLRFIEASKNISQFSTTLIKNSHPNSEVEFGYYAELSEALAISIIEEAERGGQLKPGQTVVEATSGNTGVGLAMVCAAKGYPFVATMPTSVSIERRKLMRFLGAKVILTPKADKAMGCYLKAVELAEANGWFLARQFETDANAKIHENTTAREILADFSDSKLDYWVTGYGTGGTFSGVAKVLKEQRPETKIVLSEPVNAQLIESGTAQERTADGSPSGRHPAFEPI